MTVPVPVRLYHGGVPGLRPGDVLTGGHARAVRDDCPTCQARAAGTTTIDAPSTHPDAVYLTSERLYAKHYASLYGRGDLYVVEPLGSVWRSVEDSVPTWVAESGRVLKVYDRAVLLTMTERRRLFREWGEWDAMTVDAPAHGV